MFRVETLLKRDKIDLRFSGKSTSSVSLNTQSHLSLLVKLIDLLRASFQILVFNWNLGNPNFEKGR